MRRNTAWAFAGNTVYAGCQWAVFVLLVKSLPADRAGAFALATAVTGPVFVLASVRLRNLLATSADSIHVFPDYFRARLLTTSAAVAVSLLIAALVFRASGALAVVGVMAAGRACEAISDICHGLFQRELSMRTAAVGLTINALISVLLVAAALRLAPSVMLATAAYSAGSLLALAFWDLPRARVVFARAVHTVAPRADAGRRSYRGAWQLLVKASPMGLSSAVGSVQTNLPRYVITSVLGPASLAAFAAISYVTMAGHLVVNAMSQAALPMLAIDVRESRERYHLRLGALVLVTAAAGTLAIGGALLFGGPLLTLVYGPQYGQYADVLVWLIAATVVSFTSVFLGTGTTAQQRFGSQLIISVTSLVVVAASIMPLVARYGLLGAAWSLLAGAIVELTGYVTRTLHDVPPAVITARMPEGAQL
jgi:O-antigen/teichoic acid export membrane protein